MPEHVEGLLIKERAAFLRELSKKQEFFYKKSFIGKKLFVLWEKELSDKSFIGKTRNYLQVKSLREMTALKKGMETQVELKGFLDSGELLVI